MSSNNSSSDEYSSYNICCSTKSSRINNRFITICTSSKNYGPLVYLILLSIILLHLAILVLGDVTNIDDEDEQQQFQSQLLPDFPDWINSILDYFRPPVGKDEMDAIESALNVSQLIFEIYSQNGENQCQLRGVPNYAKLEKFCPDYAFDRRDMAVLVHGMTDSLNYTSSDYLYDKGNIISNFNTVILVNWSLESHIRRYLKVLRTRRILGQIIGDLLLLLYRTKALSLDRVHMMGFSMGAQIVAFAARHVKETLDKQNGSVTPAPTNNTEQLEPNAIGQDTNIALDENKIGMVTGFDANSPLVSRKLSLDKNDGIVVQGLHTSTSWFGSTTPYGHLNYYPNGGFGQPDCPKSATSWFSFRGLYAPTICDHNYSLSLFAHTFKQSGVYCQLVGYPCQDYQSFLAGKCKRCVCSDIKCDSCHALSERPIKPLKQINDKMFFITGPLPFLCVPNFHLTFVMKRRKKATSVRQMESQFGYRGVFKVKMQVRDLAIKDDAKYFFEVDVKHNYEDIITMVVAQYTQLTSDDHIGRTGALYPAEFEKIFVYNQNNPKYLVDQIKINYLSHTELMFRRKFSGIFEETESVDDDPRIKEFIPTSGYDGNIDTSVINLRDFTTE